MVTNNYCVYKHTTPCGKVYIGITGRNPLERWQNGRGYSGNDYFYRTILKYGWDNIKHEILFSELTKDEALQKEQELIEYYNSNRKESGYNLTSGGEHYTHSEESKKKISKAHKGKTLSEEHKAHLSAARIGSKRNEETKSKMSVANKRRWENMSKETRECEAERCRHMFEGYHHTEEAKQRCMMNNPKRKVIQQYSVNGKLIAEYNSIREAERQNNIKHPSVSYCINGKAKTAGGFVWQEKERW